MLIPASITGPAFIPTHAAHRKDAREAEEFFSKNQ
jgi:hypothetical protein